MVRFNEAIKQAVRDELRRRIDHGHKRATEQDRHLNVTAPASAIVQQEEGEEEEQSNKKPCLEQSAAVWQ